MFIDFLTLMLTNLVVALVLFALFMGRLIDKDAKKVCRVSFSPASSHS